MVVLRVHFFKQFRLNFQRIHIYVVKNIQSYVHQGETQPCISKRDQQSII
jgi:hypothetical protein